VADDVVGIVDAIIDGDTLDLMVDERLMRIRLQGINTTERGEPWSRKAKEALAAMTYQKQARIALNGERSRDRWVGVVWVNEKNVNLEQVRSGLAWYCRNYLDDESFALAQREARRARIGIHGEANLRRPGWCKE
jgi:endonuclease YncB( thermonuclease family)